MVRVWFFIGEKLKVLLATQKKVTRPPGGTGYEA
jgi:hypothetical protein